MTDVITEDIQWMAVGHKSQRIKTKCLNRNNIISSECSSQEISNLQINTYFGSIIV